MAITPESREGLDSVLARLWNYATGGREVAARPEGSSAVGFWAPPQDWPAHWTG